jgi:hypothetical protein
MSIIKRTLVASGAVALLAALAFAAPAQAGPGVHAKCLVLGNAKTHPPIPMTGGKGDYTFDSLSVECVAVESPPLKIVTLNIDVQSTGTYKSVICGTGKAISDHAGITVRAIAVSPESKVGFASYQAMIEDLKYEIEFVGAGSAGGPIGTGILYWHDAMGKSTIPFPKPLDLVTPKPHGQKARYEGGTVELLPPELFSSTPKPPLLPPACTKSVDIMAALDLSDRSVP